MKRSRKKLTRTPRIETLEKREVMATFGVPWPEPRSLSVSFPSDKASVGAFPNSLRERFDQVTDRMQWQYETLRAFQTWASVTNLNIGLVPDRGDDFGAVGLTSNDPRFGELRVGAFPQGGTLANAAPFDPLSGTWSGDVLLNTDINYFLADWKSSSPISIPAANDLGPAVELFSVLLHEAGNALGLADNNVAGTVMNGTYSGPRGQLSTSDINAIRRLYSGARRDIYEPVANNSLATATSIAIPTTGVLDRAISVMGSLNSRTDVDLYRFTPVAGREKVSVRLWASGISLLQAKLEVLDRNGNVLADAKADSIFANNLQLDLGSLNDHSQLYVRVSRNSNDVFAIGDYRLDIDYRDLALQPALQPAAHDADAQDDDGNGPLDYVSVDQLFADQGIVDRELGRNDTLSTATRLTTPSGYLPQSRYEVTSSVSGRADRDLWRFQTPAFASPTMSINIDTLGLDNPVLDAHVLNSIGDRVAARVTRKADGGLSLVVNSPGASRTYIVLVRTNGSSAVQVGNYAITVDFATDPANELKELYRATVNPTQEHVSQLTVNKTQLMRFDLSGLTTTAGTGVQLTIYNARTGDIELTLTATSRSSSTQYAWLSKGSYYLRATHRSTSGPLSGTPFTFRLRVDVLSDDQGIRPNNPTELADPVATEFDWSTIDQTNSPPLIDFVEPPVEDPWTNDLFQGFIRDFFGTLA